MLVLTGRTVYVFDSLSEDAKPTVVQAQAAPEPSPAETVHVPE